MEDEEDNLEYVVSILGGYDDERDISANITNMVLREMQGLASRFTLQLAITGLINTEVVNSVPWPVVCGGGVDVATGEVFPARFSSHGPDMDIRSLRLHNHAVTIINIYDHHTGKIILRPFTYSVMSDASLWLQRTDAFLLEHCSTSPAVEPPHFCDNMRAVLRRMISDPEPLVSLFPGGKSREYSWTDKTWLWSLEEETTAGMTIHQEKPKSKSWGVNDFLMSFK